MPNSTDIYLSFINSSHQRDGSMIRFMFDVADALGIGLYATEQYSESANETYPGNNDFNSYYRCMHDLENQELEIDMCIGELTFF